MFNPLSYLQYSAIVIILVGIIVVVDNAILRCVGKKVDYRT